MHASQTAALFANRSRLALTGGAVLAAAALVGCSSHDKVVGTWTNAAPSEQRFEMRGMTLAEDGTYTAYARVGDRVRGFNGEWDIVDGMLVLEEENLRYSFEREGDQLIVMDPQSDKVQALDKKRNDD